jgi:hypothetical protein
MKIGTQPFKILGIWRVGKAVATFSFQAVGFHTFGINPRVKNQYLECGVFHRFGCFAFRVRDGWQNNQSGGIRRTPKQLVRFRLERFAAIAYLVIEIM